MDKVFGGEIAGYVYTRHGNPTVAVLEEAIREIEDGATVCAYASGMAALHAALFACELSPGATVLASQDLYGVWRGRFPDDFNVDQALNEIRSSWQRNPQP